MTQRMLPMWVSELVRGSVQRRGKLSFIFVVIIQKWLFVCIERWLFGWKELLFIHTYTQRKRERKGRERGWPRLNITSIFIAILMELVPYEYEIK